MKWLELLKEIAPSVARVAVIYDPTDFNSKHMQEIEPVIASFGVQLSSFIIRNLSDIERAIDGFSIQPHGGLIILPGPFTVVHRDLIISLATRHALPNVHAYRYYPAAGGLASYGVDNVKSYLGAASYVDRILKGEKPADLPVQLPKTFRPRHQSEDRQGARPRRPADAARPRRRGDRMSAPGKAGAIQPVEVRPK